MDGDPPKLLKKQTLDHFHIALFGIEVWRPVFSQHFTVHHLYIHFTNIDSFVLSQWNHLTWMFWDTLTMWPKFPRGSAEEDTRHEPKHTWKVVYTSYIVTSDWLVVKNLPREKCWVNWDHQPSCVEKCQNIKPPTGLICKRNEAMLLEASSYPWAYSEKWVGAIRNGVTQLSGDCQSMYQDSPWDPPFLQWQICLT